MSQIIIGNCISDLISDGFNKFVKSANAPTLNGEEYMVYEPKISKPTTTTISKPITTTTISKPITTTTISKPITTATIINNSYYETVINQSGLSNVDFSCIPINVGIQFATFIITNILTDLFSDDEDDSCSNINQIYNAIISLKENLRHIHIDLKKYSKEIKQKMDIIIASTNYIESYLKHYKSNNNDCLININICNKLEKLTQLCNEKFNILIFQELNAELINYFLHKERFGDDATYESKLYIRLCIVIENIILLHVNLLYDYDAELLNKCIIIYCKIRLDMKNDNINYDKRLLVVHNLKEKLNNFAQLHAEKYNLQHIAKLEYIDILLKKCIFKNKYELQYKALCKKEYEMANIKLPSSNASLCYEQCHYESDRYYQINVIKTNANIDNIMNDQYIIAFPTPIESNLLITLIPLEFKLNLTSCPKMQHIYDAAKLGIITITHSYSISISKKHHFNNVPKISEDGWNEFIDDGKNYICIVSNNGMQDSTHGTKLIFDVVLNTYVDDIKITTMSNSIEYIVGIDTDIGSHGYWIVENYARFGYFRLDPNFIGNTIMTKLTKIKYYPTIINQNLIDKTINSLKDYISNERKIIHEKYKRDININLKLKSDNDISIAESSIYSTNLQRLKTDILNETYNSQNIDPFNILDMISI